MSKRLEEIESHVEPFNDVLHALGKFSKGEITGICGAPGIGKTVFARFLAYVFSLDKHVLYTSFQKTQLELEQRLYSTNRGRYFPENELSVDEKHVNDVNTYSYPQDENLYNLFYGDFWDSEALTSFYGSPIDFSKEQPYGSLQIGDVKYSKYSFDLLLQIEKMLNLAAHNQQFEVLIIDDLDLFPVKVQEFEEWDYVHFFQALKSLQFRYNVLIIIVSNIRFSRVKSNYISVGSSSYVEGGASFIEVCDTVVFVDRPSYYEINFEEDDEGMDTFNVYLAKNNADLAKRRSSVIKYSKDFKYLKYQASGLINY